MICQDFCTIYEKALFGAHFRANFRAFLDSLKKGQNQDQKHPKKGTFHKWQKNGRSKKSVKFGPGWRFTSL